MGRVEIKKRGFGALIRGCICSLCLALFLFLYLNLQNEITKLRIAIPQLSNKLHEIDQENTRLRYEIDRLEDPSILLSLSRKPEYRHLKHSLLEEILILPKQ